MSSLITFLLLLIIGRDVYAAEISLRKSSASSFSLAQQNLFLMKENQRLKKEIQRLKERDEQPKLLQQYDLPSYSLLEIGIHQEKLRQEVDVPSLSDLWDAASTVGESIYGTKQAVEAGFEKAHTISSNAIAAAAQKFGELKTAAAESAKEQVQSQFTKLIGKCEQDCLEAVYNETKDRIVGSHSINLAFIGHQAFEHFEGTKPPGSGMKKMLIGVVFNSLNGLFDWAMPDIRRVLKSAYTSQVQPIFKSKILEVQNALLKYSTVNIYDVMQNTLVENLRHSISTACSILPSFSFVVEVNVPPYCETIVTQILSDLPWIHGIAKILAQVADDAVKAATNGTFPPKDPQKPILSQVSAVSIVDYLQKPIGAILQDHFQPIANGLKEVADHVLFEPELKSLKDQAAALAKTSCKIDKTTDKIDKTTDKIDKTTDLMCMLDIVANIFFLLFDRKKAQIAMANMIYHRMDDLIYEQKVFDFMINFGGVSAKPQAGAAVATK